MKYNDNRDLDIPIRDLSKKAKRIKSVIKVFRKHFPDKVSVLDVGTRDGYAVELLNKKGYQAEGIELLGHYVEHAKAMGRPVTFGDMMDQSTLPEKKYDIIYSRHCIEHCRDSLTFMKSCEWLLNPNGNLFMIFPMESDNMLKRHEPYHMVNFPDKESFKKFLEKTNFKIIKLGPTYEFGLQKRKKKELFFIGEKSD